MVKIGFLVPICLKNSFHGVLFCNFVASTFYSRHILHLPQVLRVNIQKNGIETNHLDTQNQESAQGFCNNHLHHEPLGIPAWWRDFLAESTGNPIRWGGFLSL